MIKIRTFVVLLLVTCLTLPIVALGIFFNASVKHDMNAHAVERNQVLASSIAELVGAHMQQPLYSLRQVMREQQVGKKAEDKKGQLDVIVREAGFFQSIFLLDQDGLVLDVGTPERLNALRPELEGLDFRGHDLFNKGT
ncbi:MAG: hypothetical protein JKY27_04130, partial [Magnetovibrio sp.]|nr:hypothetical protein [Magnetovibrio sp.]